MAIPKSSALWLYLVLFLDRFRSLLVLIGHFYHWCLALILNGYSFWYIVCLYVTRCLGKDLERQITFLQVDSNGCIYSFISCRNHKRSHESHILKDGFSLLQEGKYQHDIEVMSLVGCFKNSFHYLLCWIFCYLSFWMIPILNNWILNEYLSYHTNL